MSEEEESLEGLEGPDRQLVGLVKTHVDGNPNPRLEELIDCDQLRRAHGLESFILVIAIDDENESRGFAAHAWVVFRRHGRIAYEKSEFEIVSNDEL